MLDDEIWIMGENARLFMLKAEVIPTKEPLRAAAFAKAMPKFLHTPKSLKEIVIKKTDLTTKAILDMENEDKKEMTAEEIV